MHPRRLSTGLLALTLGALGCQDAPQANLESAPLAPAAVRVAPPTRVAASVDLPPHPESAVHDADADAYLVSNLGTNTGTAAFAHLFATDDNGFISRVELDPDGSVASVTEHWIGAPGLTPTPVHTADVDGITGVTISGGDLYAVDRDEILVFDLGSETFETSIPLPASGVAASSDLSLPNDVVVAGGTSVTLWLTDTGLDASAGRTFTDAVWSWDGSSWTKVVGDAAGSSDVGCPNGIDLDGSGDPLFLTFCSNQVLAIGSGGAVTTAATVEPNPASGAGVGRLDGLVHRADGSLLFSDWRVPQDGHGKIHRHGTGQGVAAARLSLPADIGHDAGRQRVLIPSDGHQQLKVVELKR